MSEAIIIYRGRGGGVSEEDKKPKVYTNNGEFVAPFTGNYLVSCVGGGGGGGGGCRNSWNSSQVFYGAGGTRGTLSSGNVFLNQGDKVTLSMGAGGTKGTNNMTVVSNNSRGTSGGTGGTTTFGSYKSGSGGTAGLYSWSWHTWSNSIIWNNVIASTKIVGDTSNNTFVSNPWHITNGSICGICEHIITSLPNGVYGGYFRCKNCFRDTIWNGLTPWLLNEIFSNYLTVTTWNNTYTWNNKVSNYTTRCYTSIQSGTWWYLNNNNVSTTGTRAYNGDGGQSGGAGNSGFILIYPQWSE